MLLKVLINSNESIFLDTLQNMYRSPHDTGGKVSFERAMNAKMPTSFMTKHDVTKLNEFFGKLQQACQRSTLTLNNRYKSVVQLKNKLNTSNQVHQRLIAHAFNPCPTNITQSATNVTLFAIDDELHVSALEARGYDVKPKNVDTRKGPEPSGLSGGGNLCDNCGGPRGQGKLSKLPRPPSKRCTICGNDPARQPFRLGFY